jgi:hypothetical protein
MFGIGQRRLCYFRDVAPLCEAAVVKIEVKAQNLRDVSYQDLVKRVTSVTEMLINNGAKIIAIPVVLQGTGLLTEEWVATIFWSVEPK